MSHATKIEAGNEKALQEAISAAEDRASARTLTAAQVIAEATWMESWLAGSGVPLARRAGVEIDISGAVQLPNAYGHNAQATCVSIRGNTAGWRLVRAQRSVNGTRRTGVQFPFSAMELAQWAVAGFYEPDFARL